MLVTVVPPSARPSRVCGLTVALLACAFGLPSAFAAPPPKEGDPPPGAEKRGAERVKPHKGGDQGAPGRSVKGAPKPVAPKPVAGGTPKAPNPPKPPKAPKPPKLPKLPKPPEATGKSRTSPGHQKKASARAPALATVAAAPAASAPASAPAETAPRSKPRSPRKDRSGRRKRDRSRAAAERPAPRASGPAPVPTGARAEGTEGRRPAAKTPAAPERTRDRGGQGAPQSQDEPLPQPLRVARSVIGVIPTELWVALGALGLLCLLFGLANLVTLLRNRKLARQRRELLGEVGLLQAALLPDLPESLPALDASIAYRPAEGPAAGGDFYDVLSLPGDRTALIVGDVSGHGRAALARTALTRYTLAAYVEAGLEPRETLRMAGAVLAGKLRGEFVTALIAVHDPDAGTLTYATAGHPAPIVLANDRFEPILAGTPPPLGAGVATGQRQTVVPFPAGAMACLFTDGLAEARTRDGRFGQDRLQALVEELGSRTTAEQVVDEVTRLAVSLDDDAAACVIRAKRGPAIMPPRVEEIELTRAEIRGPLPGRFLDACDLGSMRTGAALREAAEVARSSGSAVLHVHFGDRVGVAVHSPDLLVEHDTIASRA
jgi:Stage II sporulation protein E (SpoIIE)